jgi:DNA-binding transcriptional regulator PaaX
MQPWSHSSSRSSQSQWVLLAYRMPRTPSTPRSAVWRKLKRLGVAQLLDGLVALPCDSRNREQLEWIAEEVVDAGGEASVWVGQLASRKQERELAGRMSESTAGEYRALLDDVNAARLQPAGRRSRSVKRLRREMRRIRARDYFPPPERESAQRAVEELAARIEEQVR